MAKGVQSYFDALQEINRAVSTAMMTPDADLDFLQTMQSMILERVANPEMAPQGVSAAGAQPGFSAQMMQPQAPVPVTQAPTRLPGGLGAPGEDELAAFKAGMAPEQMAQ